MISVVNSELVSRRTICLTPTGRPSDESEAVLISGRL